ncbi:MAG: hypothetical protein ACXW16_04310 [Burkholderiaceae bacterium]
MHLQQVRLRGVCALLFGLICAWAELAYAATSFEFATVEQGQAIIRARDEYIERLSPLERALKAKSALPVSEADFLRLLTSAVRAWSDADRATVQAALDSIRPQLAVLNLPLPQTVVFVRFTGAAEGNAPHTRANAVLLSEESLQRPATLAPFIAHELFHIASRQDKAWRDALYATVGFVSIDEPALPAPLALRKITNPDAPRIDVAIKVNTADGTAWVTPLLQSTVDRYDEGRGGEFFAFMRLRWLEVARGESPPRKAQLSDSPRLHNTADLRGFHEQIGRNTQYIIHPEEILAENFAQLATGETGPSPEVHQRLRDAMQRHKR